MASACLFAKRMAISSLSRSSQRQLRLASTFGFRPAASAFSATLNTSLPMNTRWVATISAGHALSRLASEHPHMEIVRYEHKNVKWTLKHVNYYAEALACGFLDTGLQPGDIVLSWLPLHFAEQHILQFACSKAGLVLYHLDPNHELAKSDPEKSKASLAKALELTKANVLISQEAGNDVNYINLCEGVIPEIRVFDFAEGMQFFTPRYPHLRFPIHTGFSIGSNDGMCLFKHFLVPNKNLDMMISDSGSTGLDGKTPLLGELVYDNDGIPVKTGKILSNEEVFNGKVWPEFTSILSRQYKEVPGVGVIF